MVQKDIKWSETLLRIPQKWQSFRFLGISFDSLLDFFFCCAMLFPKTGEVMRIARDIYLEKLKRGIGNGMIKALPPSA